MGKKVVPTLRQEVKVKVDIITSDDSKIYYTGIFQDFTANYIINDKNRCWGVLAKTESRISTITAYMTGLVSVKPKILYRKSECACVGIHASFGFGQFDKIRRLCYEKSVKNSNT